MKKALLSILLLTAWSSSAQEIRGTVKDSKNKPLINASVLIRQGGIWKDSCATDTTGAYNVKHLDPGYYDVTASMTGFQASTIRHVIVIPGEKTRLNFTLKDTGIDMKSMIVDYRKPTMTCGGLGPSIRSAEIGHYLRHTIPCIDRQPILQQLLIDKAVKRIVEKTLTLYEIDNRH